MNIAMLASDVAKWIAFGECRVRCIHGWNNQAANVYIQLHEVSQGTVAASQIQPANATVPTYKSLLAQPGNGFYYGDIDVNFRELVVCCSTTEPNLTIVGANGGLDMTIEVDSPYLVPQFSTLTVVGDLTNDVTTLQIWAEANGPNRLMRIDSRQGADGVIPIVAYAIDTPAATNKVQFSFLNSSSTVTAPTDRNFGQGTSFIEQTAGFVNHYGLTVQPQATTAPQANPGLHAKIRAMFI